MWPIRHRYRLLFVMEVGVQLILLHLYISKYQLNWDFNRHILCIQLPSPLSNCFGYSKPVKSQSVTIYNISMLEINSICVLQIWISKYVRIVELARNTIQSTIFKRPWTVTQMQRPANAYIHSPHIKMQASLYAGYGSIGRMFHHWFLWSPCYW